MTRSLKNMRNLRSGEYERSFLETIPRSIYVKKILASLTLPISSESYTNKEQLLLKLSTNCAQSFPISLGSETLKTVKLKSFVSFQEIETENRETENVLCSELRLN